jgi:ribosomal protein S27AE
MMSKTDRVALFELPEVQAILKMFADGTLTELAPEFHPSLGVLYPKLEQVAGDKEKAKALLDRLVRAGIFHTKFYEKTVLCPSCGSANISFRYYCTYCGSHEIEKRNLYEHIQCGAIESDKDHVKGEVGNCSRCGKPLNLSGKDVRQVGAWFECRGCKKQFVAPEGKHYCRDCQLKFGVKESVLNDVYSYVVDKATANEFSREVLFLAPLRKILEETGFKVEDSPVVQGVSGTSHSFDLIGSKTQGKAKTMITLDMALSDKVCGEENVISVFAKSFDVSPTKSILVAVPALSDTARKLADLYKVGIIEGRTPEEIAQIFRETLSRIS